MNRNMVGWTWKGQNVMFQLSVFFSFFNGGSTLAARRFSLSERRSRRGKAFDNLTSMHRLIDIEKTSNLMRDITYQSASLVPTVLWCQIQNSMFHIKYENKNLNLKFGCQIPKLNFGGRIHKNCRTHWTFSTFKTSISGTLQQHFDYDQWPSEIKLTAILKTCLNLILLLHQSEYSLELTSSWNQSNC